MNEDRDMSRSVSEGRNDKGSILQLQVTWVKAVLLAVLLVGPWIVIGSIVMRRPAKEQAAIPVVSKAKVRPSVSGPWGELETTRILIEPPEAFVDMDFSKVPEVQWWLGDYTVDQAKQLFADVGLSVSQVDGLMATAQSKIFPKGVSVKPSRELILALSPEQRAKLYLTLNDWPENSKQVGPYRFPAAVADEWLANSSLPVRDIELVKRLTYRHGTMLLFADLDTVLPMLGNDDERLHLVKTLARTSTLLATVRIYPETDVDAMVAYWSKAGRAKDVKPFLTSIPRVPGGIAVDISHLMPPFARKLIYTYPYPTSELARLRRDCHWTSLNFFREEPDARFESLAEVKKELETNYFVVSGKPSFGDVLLLRQNDGTILHSCVYVAGDIVYTKNGSQAYIPWSLMELSDVLALYSEYESVEVLVYRLKDN